MLAIALLAGSAFGAAPRVGLDSTLASVEVVAYEQSMDGSGNPLGPRTRVSAEAHAPSARALRVAAAKPRPAAARKASRTLQGSGCKTVWVSRIGRSLLGFTVWKYTQEKYFCWSSPRVTVVQTNAYPCCTDPTWRFTGQIGSAGWFFSWSGDSKGGHYTFRQGRFEQVLLGRLFDSDEPWTKIWVYGNGDWAYNTGA